ncbi:sigma 54-interacting transcriptional regulator [Oceanobacillus sojae]|uniref:sigma 54-interacting transcriptional regulator n=1 Tax=Oceanobacillus sojae TaxID=582851 RepID=UPI0021A48CB0|nr:sigma 54-interacting transcriptional regulator [Oceanobacillus sojae]MCT1902040.1 sigma 54-interacting transcriptional regulator [Oceanobacillus sojae]
MDNFKSKIEEISKNRLADTFRLEAGVEAQYISDKLDIHRSTASRYLNELTRSQILIKVSTRPAYFFNKLLLENKFDISLDKNIYGSFEELNDALYTKNKKKINDPFYYFIGNEGSLKNQIEQSKAAISYPPSGLPFMIVGETGVGKSDLAQLIYQYAKNKKILHDNAPFITLNCAEFANNPELVTANLFGYTKGAFTGADKDTNGIIEEADQGVLFLDEAHRLNAESQEKLFLFMDKGIYHPLGDNSNWKKANVRMLFATTEDPEEAFLKTFMRRIPIIVSIPPLRERTDSEKYHLICTFYKEESSNVNKQLQVNSKVIKALMAFNAQGNVGELKNIVIYSCAKAYIDYADNQSSPLIEVHLKHLPMEVISNFINNDSNISFHTALNKSVLIDSKSDWLGQKHHVENNNALKNLYEGLLIIINKYLTESLLLDAFLEKASLLVNQYLEKLIYINSNGDKDLEFNTLKYFLEGIAESVDISVKTNITKNSMTTMAYFIKDITQINYEYTNEKDIGDILKTYFPKEFWLIDKICSEVESTFGISMNLLDKVILIVYIRSLNESLNLNRTKAIIIAHGYSTASSIANISNKLLGEYVFEAFDMPIDVSLSEIVHKLNNYFKSIDTSKGIIIFVDMGSLMVNYKKFKNISNSTVGIVNNITTQIAIDAGEKIIRGNTIEQILEGISQNYRPAYQIIKAKSSHKKNTIISTCITGIGTAVKIKELLDKGIRKGSGEIYVLPYDFLSLKNNGIEENIFKEYNVIGIIGTVNPKVQDISFIAIEDIISGKGEQQLKEMLKNIVPQNIIGNINEDIVKLFSLQDVINHLIILNPDKIIENLSISIEKLQQQLNIRFNNPTRISLYVHLSCLIERLVKKSPIVHHVDLATFQHNHQDFIHILKRVFNHIEEVYSVEIPLSEIVYIHDIIKMKHSDFKY